MTSKILKTKKSVSKMRCGYCPRVIFRADETDGEFKEMDKKPICPVCRVLRTSKFRDEIKADKVKYDAIKIKKAKEDAEKARALAVDVAVASQIRAGKKYKLKK